MVIPLGDGRPTRSTPWVARLLLLGNVGVFLLVQPVWGATACDTVAFFHARAVIPAEVLQGEPLTADQLGRSPSAAACGIEPVPGKPVHLAVLTSMFLHAGWLHLLGNMLYLWIFGDNVEDRLGHLGFAVFYLLCGVVATSAFVAANPDGTVPLVGASGAIAGVLGAYLVMFPRQPVTVAVPILFFVLVEVPAVLVLGMWFLLQLRELTPGVGSGGGVAYLAHAAGFTGGVVVTLLLGHRPERGPARARRRRRAQRPPGWG